MNAPAAMRPRPALHEPMLWLVWGLPALVVIAGIATLVIALRAGGADAVPAEVRRTAQIQVEDLQADREAQRLGLRAELRRDAATGAVQLRLEGAVPPADPQLRLRLRHPAQAGRDRELRLVRAANAWHGRLEPDGAQAWNLVPLDARWRLSGRLAHDATAAALQPRWRE
jgi:hypothetical protein